MDKFKRREFIRLLGASSLGLSSSCSLFHHICSSCSPSTTSRNQSIPTDPKASKIAPETHVGHAELDLKRDNFERDFPDDILASAEEWELIQGLAKKLSLIESYVGHGNFNIISWDEMIFFARYATGIEEFSVNELSFLEKLFFFDAQNYGFLGQKVLTDLTSSRNKDDLVKVPYSGHFLLREASLDVYQKVKQDVGESLILTSGYRALVKQFHLFLEKSVETRGNYSRASRSLAPPGYSFHARGDFDVGKVGHGLKNFTGDFAKTDEYRRLIDLGYVDIRYTEDNLLGVRFEPWHIKVLSS